MDILAFFLGGILVMAGVWLGFYLARLSPDSTPSLPDTHTYEGAILDLAVYPDELADE